MENSQGNWVKPPTSCTMEGTAVAMIVLSSATRPVVSIRAPRTGPRSDLNPTPSVVGGDVAEVMSGVNRLCRAVFRCHHGAPRVDEGRKWPSRLQVSKNTCYRRGQP